MKHFAIIGNPVEHSLSPIMHQWVYDNLKIDAQYKKFKTEESELLQIVQKMKNGEFDGINITIPYKEKIIDYLFPENPLICCGVSSRTFATRHREEWRGKLEKMQLIVPSPMSSKYGKTQTGKESMHTMENTGPRAYLVVEFDEGSHDDHAALLWYLNSGISPLICAVRVTPFNDILTLRV